MVSVRLGWATVVNTRNFCFLPYTIRLPDVSSTATSLAFKGTSEVGGAGASQPVALPAPTNGLRETPPQHRQLDRIVRKG